MIGWRPSAFGQRVVSFIGRRGKSDRQASRPGSCAKVLAQESEAVQDIDLRFDLANGLLDRKPLPRPDRQDRPPGGSAPSAGNGSPPPQLAVDPGDGRGWRTGLGEPSGAAAA